MAGWKDVGAQAKQTASNWRDAVKGMAGAFSGVGKGAANGAKDVAEIGNGIAGAAATSGLSVLNGQAKAIKRNPEVAVIAAAIAVVVGGVAWFKRSKKEKQEEARTAEVDDLQSRIAANRLARQATVADIGALNPSNTGHVAATGRGQGMSQSA